MGDDKARFVRAWLTKSRNDFETAQQLGEMRTAHLDVAIYHCQQSAEKALKGFLAYHDLPLERTHDLKRLVQLGSQIHPAFLDLLLDAAALTPYATLYRYPDGLDESEPTAMEFQEALAAAESIVQMVVAQLPPATHPR